MVDVLYIDNRGPYPELVGAARCWGAERDARLYTGIGPVVAHPPCGPWGRLRHMYTGNEHELAPLAVGVVQRLGGVLEHPANSRLWERSGLPYPDDGLGPDEFGGFTLQVDQCDWGHVARKKTWLYIVNKSGRDMFALTQAEAWLRERSGNPTHYVSGFTGARSGSAPEGIKICSAEQRRRTPKRFARWLVSIAERCSRLT